MAWQSNREIKWTFTMDEGSATGRVTATFYGVTDAEGQALTELLMSLNRARMGKPSEPPPTPREPPVETMDPDFARKLIFD